MFVIINLMAQPCSGSWALQRPATAQCVVGQWIGWQNSGNPAGCPTNPIYSGTQVNTFTFLDAVSLFYLDFKGFDGPPGCPRIEIKINGIFYLLTAANLSDFPTGSTCTTGSFSYVTISPDGYLTISSLGGSSLSGYGRIMISNVNANSVTISSNDVSGTVFSNPFNCTTVPLKLESFTGQNNNCKALLNWKTGIEFNVKNIEIERSEDGNFFHKVGEVSPKGSDSRYLFNTANTSNGFFRLKINDLDGYYEYSDIIHINSTCNNDNYSISPNPTSGEIKIFGLKKSDQLLISDILGKIIMQFDAPANNKLNIQSLPSGIYVLQVFNAGSRKASLKLIRN
jgi:hypothetical protein